jgi:hypothetical protein
VNTLDWQLKERAPWLQLFLDVAAGAERTVAALLFHRVSHKSKMPRKGALQPQFKNVQVQTDELTRGSRFGMVQRAVEN